MTLRNRIQARHLLNHGRSRQDDDLAGRIEDFTQAIGLNPALADAFYERGKSHYRLAEYATALTDFDEVIRLKPKEAAAYYQRALVRLKIYDYQAAVDDMTEFIKSAPYDSKAHFLRGIANGGAKNHDAAIQDFTRVLELTLTWHNASVVNKHASMAFRFRGYAHQELGDIDKALHDYEMAIQLNPLDPEPLYHRASVYVKKGDMETLALADLAAAIELNPDFTNAYYLRSSIYHDLDQQDNAISDYTRVITLDPDNHCPFINRGELYFVQAHYDLALNDFREALRLKPDFAMAQADLSITLHYLGDISEAQTLWRQLIDTDTQYRDMAWVKSHLRWADELADEAQKLLDSLQ